MKGVVIIPCRGPGDSGDFLLKTLEHMYYPRPKLKHEIIIVDDNESQPIDQAGIEKQFPGIHIIRTSGGIGCAGSRDFGVANSPVGLEDSDILIFLDAHMNPNLYQDQHPGNFIDKIADHISRQSKRIFCGKCYALDPKTWYGFTLPKSRAGNGATIEFQGPDDVFEPRWIDTRSGKLPPYFKKLAGDPLAYRIPIIHGACYAMTVAVFNALEGFSGLLEWGSDEVYLCLKAYIAGRKEYQCGVMSDVAVGHVFSPTGPHPERNLYLVMNKFRVVKELFPADLVGPYIELIRLKEKEGEEAYKRYLEQESAIEKRRAYWIKKFSEDSIEGWFKAFEREFETPELAKRKKAGPFLKKFTAAVQKPRAMKAFFTPTARFTAPVKLQTCSGVAQNSTPPPDGP